jgi:formate hydrogenlyase transcriptional activator
VIDRAAVGSTGNCLELPERWTFSIRSFFRAAEVSLHIRPVPRELTLEELQRSHILRVMQQTGWRFEGRKGAADILGLNPSTFRSPMLKLASARLSWLKAFGTPERRDHPRDPPPIRRP